MGSPAEEGLEIALDFIYSIVECNGGYCYDCTADYYAEEAWREIDQLGYGIIEDFMYGKEEQRQGEEG
jgi:hypothetical protein